MRNISTSDPEATRARIAAIKDSLAKVDAELTWASIYIDPELQAVHIERANEELRGAQGLLNIVAESGVVTLHHQHRGARA